MWSVNFKVFCFNICLFCLCFVFSSFDQFQFLCFLSFSVSIFLGSIEFSVLLASSYFSVSDFLEQSELSVLIFSFSVQRSSTFCFFLAVYSAGLHFFN